MPLRLIALNDDINNALRAIGYDAVLHALTFDKTDIEGGKKFRIENETERLKGKEEKVDIEGIEKRTTELLLDREKVHRASGESVNKIAKELHTKYILEPTIGDIEFYIQDMEDITSDTPCNELLKKYGMLKYIETLENIDMRDYYQPSREGLKKELTDAMIKKKLAKKLNATKETVFSSIFAKKGCVSITQTKVENWNPNEKH